jgi:hypothetical protein
MGGTIITMEIKGQSERTLNGRFNSRRREDRAYYGDNPYSGSWAGVPSVRLVDYPNAPKVWTKKQYRLAFDWLDENLEKWEEAKAIKTTTGFIVAAFVAT